CNARSVFNRTLQAKPQHNRRAMAGNLNHIFSRVGTRSLKEANDYLIDYGIISIQQLRKLAGPASPMWSLHKSQDSFGDISTFFARKTNDAQASAAQRSGYRDNGVAQIHFEVELTRTAPTSATRRSIARSRSTAVSLTATLVTAAASIAVSFRSTATIRRARCGRSRWGRHIGRDDHHSARGSYSHAFATQFLLVAQREVDYPAFTAAHGIEVKRYAGLLHFVGGSQCTHAKLFNTQQPIIVGIEGNQRVIFGWKTQSFHGEVLQRE